MLIVLKFGGSSLADQDKIKVAAGRIRAEWEQGNQVVAVVSAQGDTTDELITKALEINPVPSAREMDAYLSTGEQQSAALVAMALEAMGCPAVSLTGIQAGIETDGICGNARVLGMSGDRIRKELAAGKAVVVAGFQGNSGTGDVVTLGRGGSDTTAVALAAWLRAEECRIYTDVDGVYDKDPRKYSDAVKFETIGYRQMLTMARQGAQVLHDRCVELAMEHRVPIRVVSSFRGGAGTLVTDPPDHSCRN